MLGFLRYEFGGLIFGGAYFRIFTVVRAIPQIQHSGCESLTPI